MNNTEQQNLEHIARTPSITRKLIGVGGVLGIALGPTLIASTPLGGEMDAVVDIFDASEASAQVPPITCDIARLVPKYIGDINGDGSKYGDANIPEWWCTFPWGGVVPDSQPPTTPPPPKNVDYDGDGVTEPWPDNCDNKYNPDQADMDGDGDGDVCDSDIDGDGLSNTDEITIYGTDPYNPDTDSDGLNDNVDPNPLDVDIDNDGLTDLEEVVLGTNPNVADTDGGGVPDGVEVSHGYDPLNKKDDKALDEILNPTTTTETPTTTTIEAITTTVLPTTTEAPTTTTVVPTTTQRPTTTKQAVGVLSESASNDTPEKSNNSSSDVLLIVGSTVVASIGLAGLTFLVYKKRGKEEE